MSAKEKMVQRARQAFSNTSYRPDAHLTTQSWPIPWGLDPKKRRIYRVRQRKFPASLGSSTTRTTLSRGRHSPTLPPNIW